MAIGTPQQYSGTATQTVTKVNFVAQSTKVPTFARRVAIQNLSSDTNLRFSFNGGVDWSTLLPRAGYNEPGTYDKGVCFKVEPGDDSVMWEMTATVAG